VNEPIESATSLSLLLVEEDDRAAERLFEVLSRPEGTRFDITMVACVEDALAKLQDGDYDVLLLDLAVHEGQGLDSLLRARVAARHVPIVVLTYHKDEALALKAARAGAQDYLTKGEVTPELITRTLLHAVERHRMLRDLIDAQDRQRFLATHDTLTELPNRYSFLEQLGSALADAARNESELAVMFFDLDGFKTVNDNLGHSFGDELLTDVARRLRKMIRKSDLVARLGGDEFVAAIRNIPDRETPLMVAEKIREEIEKPYHLAEVECWVSTSVGISVFPQDGTEADALIRCADSAMYRAKSSGKNRVCLFDNEMKNEAAERFSLVNGLREAIHSGQLVLMFQPQIQVATEEIVAAEALVRWQHPTRGLVSPSGFISVAEETGMMVPLGEWVLRTACTAAAGWSELPHTRVAVNVSGRQLDQPNFPQRVGTILAEVGLPAGRLEIEVTESLVATESALKVLARLREMGVRTAIDDFGTGFSSLAQLKRLPVDTLKIDQSFVRGVTTTGPEAVILAAIIRMGQGLGLEVMAEGVETQEEMDALCQFGCSLMQGYLFSKPVMRREFEQCMIAPDAPWRSAVERPEGWSSPRGVPAEKERDIFPVPLRPGDSDSED